MVDKSKGKEKVTDSDKPRQRELGFSVGLVPRPGLVREVPQPGELPPDPEVPAERVLRRAPPRPQTAEKASTVGKGGSAFRVHGQSSRPQEQDDHPMLKRAGSSGVLQVEHHDPLRPQAAELGPNRASLSSGRWVVSNKDLQLQPTKTTNQSTPASRSTHQQPKTPPTCSLCRKNVSDAGPDVIIFRCGHLYHIGCLWKATQGCVLCKTVQPAQSTVESAPSPVQPAVAIPPPPPLRCPLCCLPLGSAPPGLNGQGPPALLIMSCQHIVHDYCVWDGGYRDEAGNVRCILCTHK